MSTMGRIIIFVRGEEGVGLFPNKNPAHQKLLENKLSKGSHEENSWASPFNYPGPMLDLHKLFSSQ